MPVLLNASNKPADRPVHQTGDEPFGPVANNANEGKSDFPAAVSTGAQYHLRHMRRGLAAHVKMVGVGPFGLDLVCKKWCGGVARENRDHINAVALDLQPQ